MYKVYRERRSMNLRTVKNKVLSGPLNMDIQKIYKSSGTTEITLKKMKSKRNDQLNNKETSKFIF